MAEIAITMPGEEPPRRRLRQDWVRRLLNELFALFVALLFLFAGLLVLLDSAPGHRFIVDQIGKLETASGLRIRIGRIDGSIFGKSQLKSVTIADSRGVFLASPNIKVDWTPGAWLNNKLYVDSLTAEHVSLVRLPKLRPSTKKGPILPGFDIHIGELRIDRLDIGPQVGGRQRSGSVRGKADVRAGRALVELAAVVNKPTVALHLDAEPIAKFDVGARSCSGRRSRSSAHRHSDRSISDRQEGRLLAGAARRRSCRAGPCALALGVDSVSASGQWAPRRSWPAAADRTACHA
jgi:translocation and assembly module TamB